MYDVVAIKKLHPLCVLILIANWYWMFCYAILWMSCNCNYVYM